MKNSQLKELMDGFKYMKDKIEANDRRGGGRTRDFLITTNSRITAEPSSARVEFGKYWDGLKTDLDQMPKELRAQVYAQLDAYRDVERAASVAVGGGGPMYPSKDQASKDHDPLDRWKFAARNEALNKAARERWGQKPSR